jgi:hypothetical protein
MNPTIEECIELLSRMSQYNIAQINGVMEANKAEDKYGIVIGERVNTVQEDAPSQDVEKLIEGLLKLSNDDLVTLNTIGNPIPLTGVDPGSKRFNVRKTN